MIRAHTHNLPTNYIDGCQDGVHALRRALQHGRGVELSRWIAGSSQLRELVAAELEPGLTAATMERLDQYLENTVGGYGHAVGTCQMGPASDPDAVADRLVRVHGTENVFVADASMMPGIPATNTNLTCYVIGRHIADLFAEQNPGP